MNRVINFHEIHDQTWFETVIKLLKEKYRMVSIDEVHAYMKGERKINNSCLVTVDDGQQTSYSLIYPVLKKHQVPAVFFVSPYAAQHNDDFVFWFQAIHENKNLTNEILHSRLTVDEIYNFIRHNIDKRNISYGQNMTVEQICQIDKEGLVAIGAHTLVHPFLARESDERSKQEIIQSIKQLSSILEHPVKWFAYPNGRPIFDWGQREVEILKETSVELAFSTEPVGFTHHSNPYGMPRFGLSSGSMNFIKMKLFLGRYYPICKTMIEKIKQS